MLSRQHGALRAGDCVNKRGVDSKCRAAGKVAPGAHGHPIGLLPLKGVACRRAGVKMPAPRIRPAAKNFNSREFSTGQAVTVLSITDRRRGGDRICERAMRSGGRVSKCLPRGGDSQRLGKLKRPSGVGHTSVLSAQIYGLDANRSPRRGKPVIFEINYFVLLAYYSYVASKTWSTEAMSACDSRRMRRNELAVSR